MGWKILIHQSAGSSAAAGGSVQTLTLPIKGEEVEKYFYNLSNKREDLEDVFDQTKLKICSFILIQNQSPQCLT